jgi:hypothetical protein
MQIEDYKPQDVEWCDTCREHETGKCDGCKKAFDSQEQKYRSQSFHYHPVHIDGSPGTYGIHKTLCLECYRKDWKKVYPKEKLPV